MVKSPSKAMCPPDDTAPGADESVGPPFADRSATLGKLAAALAAAQGQIKLAKKDAENRFSSRYADLASLWEACREPLSKNSLAVIQLTGYSGADEHFLETVLVHESNEWISSRLYFTPGYTDRDGKFIKLFDADALGAALTRVQRYGLRAIVGIAAESTEDAGEPGEHGQGTRRKSDEQRPGAPRRSIRLDPAAPKKEHVESLLKMLRHDSIDPIEFLKVARQKKFVPENKMTFDQMPNELALSLLERYETIAKDLKTKSSQVKDALFR